LTERVEIWHNDGHWSVTGLKQFWCSFALPTEYQKFWKVDILHSFYRSVTKFGIVNLAIRHFSPKFGKLWSEGLVIPCSGMCIKHSVNTLHCNWNTA